MNTAAPRSVIMIGATGAVGGQCVDTLVTLPEVQRLTLLGRRRDDARDAAVATQHVVDLLDPGTYESLLPGHDTAICTLGVGQPSTISRERFVRIDRDLVLDFARACRGAGVRHFQLLGSVGASPDARQFHLRTKGELEQGLIALAFERLSLFHPSMILTPTNRYGFSQALVLRLWPLAKPLLRGPLEKFRGIEVENLGRAMALNTVHEGDGRRVETLEWEHIMRLADRQGR